MMKANGFSAGRSGEGGFALIFGLIMLVLTTLLAVTAFQLGVNQTLVVANAQHTNEAIDAAQQAIDVVINTSNFTQNPAAAIASSNCSGGGANALCLDANGDGVNDITVNLTPQPKCITAAPIPVSSLDFSKSDDLGCSVQTQQNFGVSSASVTGNSLCANSVWEITGQASDVATGTTATVVQGVSVRIATTDMTAYCP